MIPPADTAPRRALSFEDLYTTDYAAVALVAGSTAGSWAVGEEVAQEAFTQAHLRWVDVKALDKPGAWVRRVAINLALNQRRGTTRERTAMDRLPERTSGPPATAEEIALWQAVAELAPKQRAAIVLHYHDGYPTAAIAEMLDTTVSAVTSSLHKARTNLAKTLGEV